MKTKPRRYCRICGKPEKHFGGHWTVYSDLTPYSQICVKCLNKALKKDNPRESCPKCGRQIPRAGAFVDHGTGAEAGRVFYYCSKRCRETH